MTLMILIAVAGWCAAAVLMAIGWARLHRLQTPAEPRPCSRCSHPTGWALRSRPLCPPCRKREIEEEA